MLLVWPIHMYSHELAAPVPGLVVGRAFFLLCHWGFIHTSQINAIRVSNKCRVKTPRAPSKGVEVQVN